MYSEDLPEERLKRANKEAKYYKWVAENQHASERENKDAKDEFQLCNTFSRPNIKK